MLPADFAVDGQNAHFLAMLHCSPLPWRHLLCYSLAQSHAPLISIPLAVNCRAIVVQIAPRPAQEAA